MQIVTAIEQKQRACAPHQARRSPDMQPLLDMPQGGGTPNAQAQTQAQAQAQKGSVTHAAAASMYDEIADRDEGIQSVTHSILEVNQCMKCVSTSLALLPVLCIFAAVWGFAASRLLFLHDSVCVQWHGIRRTSAFLGLAHAEDMLTRCTGCRAVDSTTPELQNSSTPATELMQFQSAQHTRLQGPNVATNGSCGNKTSRS